MREVTPLGAVARGLAAGALGAGVQTLFFKATARLEPEAPKDVFQPPEPRQAEEMPTQTVARRFVEGFMQRGPLGEQASRRSADLVHYGYGAAWGALWGLARESLPGLSSAAGVAAFSDLVWILGSELMLPAFKLSAWPQAYPPKVHAYSAAAHLAYGLGVCVTYDAIRRASSFVDLVATGLWALALRRKVRKALPRPAARAIGAAASVTRRRPLVRVARLVIV